MPETPLSRGTRALVDHPLTKLFERIAVGGIAFLSIWTFNQINAVTVALPAFQARLDNIERRARLETQGASVTLTAANWKVIFRVYA